MKPLFSIQDRSDSFDFPEFDTTIGLTNAKFAVTTNRPSGLYQSRKSGNKSEP